jgi:hypothetical protein
MMRKAWGASVQFGLLAAVVVGCGGGSKSNAPATASAACVQFQAASASRATRCNGGSVADWAAAEASFETCAAYDQHVRDGQVQYRRNEFDACLAKYDLPCDEDISNCRYQVLHGLVADGQPCRDTEVCGTSSACFNISNATCGEVCARAAGQGEACGFYCGGTTPCLDIAFCYPDLNCVNSVCVRPKAVGAGCGGGDLVPCGWPTYCSADPADPASTGTCVALVAGGPCRADAECPLTDFCMQGTCNPRRDVGQSCADVPTSCASWTACVGGTCSVAGKVGLPCAPYPGAVDFPYCTTGTCDGTMCVPAGNAGDSCLTAGCAPGTSCDSTTTTCVACGT